jgi:predicted aspartyl protease
MPACVSVSRMLIGVLALMPASAQTQSSVAEPPIAIPTKFDTSTDHLLIRVEVNDTPLWCNLDTGWSALLTVDRAESRRAGISEGPGRPTPDGNPPRRGDGSATATVTVGSVVLRDHPLVIRDLPVGAPDITPRIVLRDRSSYSPPAGSTSVPLIFRTNVNVPFVRVRVELVDGTEQEVQTVVDTGTAYYAVALVAPASTKARSQLLTARRPVEAESGVGPVQVDAARVAAVSVGPFRVEKPIIALVGSSLGAVDDGTLGSGFLNRFTIGFDFEGRQMYLAPNPLFRAEHPFDASGVGFRRTDRGYEVNIVLPDSTAGRADIRVGDSLVSIDGTPAPSLTPNQLRDLLARAGHTCDLVLTRAGQPLRIRLALQQRL